MISIVDYRGACRLDDETIEHIPGNYLALINLTHPPWYVLNS